MFVLPQETLHLLAKHLRWKYDDKNKPHFNGFVSEMKFLGKRNTFAKQPASERKVSWAITLLLHIFLKYYFLLHVIFFYHHVHIGAMLYKTF